MERSKEALWICYIILGNLRPELNRSSWKIVKLLNQSRVSASHALFKLYVKKQLFYELDVTFSMLSVGYARIFGMFMIRICHWKDFVHHSQNFGDQQLSVPFVEEIGSS